MMCFQYDPESLMFLQVGTAGAGATGARKTGAGASGKRETGKRTTSCCRSENSWGGQCNYAKLEYSAH